MLFFYISLPVGGFLAGSIGSKYKHIAQALLPSKPLTLQNILINCLPTISLIVYKTTLSVFFVVIKVLMNAALTVI